jgi:endonuclease/exonuclease/phosphatase (EEP) superfamily protein YafD
MTAWPSAALVAELALHALLGLLIVLTVLPLLRSQAWWVRVWDFPRPQIAGLLLLTLLGLAGLMDRAGPVRLGFLAAGSLALLAQIRRIQPFTRLHARQAAAVEGCTPNQRLALLVANLQLRNSGPDRLLDLVRRLDPEVVFVVELDTSWAAALEPLKPHYPHHLVHPRADFWGMALYSRLPLVDPQVQFLLGDYVPSIRAGLRLPSGAVVAFHGVHPKPPTLLGHGTVQRDAELLLAARAAGAGPRPAVLAGDLNAVAWSRETALFMRAGGLLDPRVGRGLFATFPANWPWFLRWPVDHIFFSGEFRLLRLAKLPDIGSDHLPLYAELCLAPGGADASRAPRPAGEPAAQACITAGRRAAGSSP